MLPRPRFVRLLCLVSFALFGLWFLTRNASPDAVSQSLPRSSSGSSSLSPQDQAGNSTLGFHQILALSSHPSWRTRGLSAAATLTGLDITIPPQPRIDDRAASAFASIGEGMPGLHLPTFGASKAWLAHLDLVKHIYQSNFETALIVEDDVDWDVEIKDQMRNISSGVRRLTDVGRGDKTPYSTDWDVLWLGHCGEQWVDWTDTVIFDDANVLPHDKYIGFWGESLAQLPDQKRAAYFSITPICTFGYALTHEGARKIISEMSAGEGEAFDVQMQIHCGSGKFRCISVVPEVFHQYFPPLEFGVKSDVDIGNGDKGGGKASEEAFEGHMGSTENILHSARCWALWGMDCLRLPPPPPVPVLEMPEELQ